MADRCTTPCPAPPRAPPLSDILGKYSPLDFETSEPINPLDGVMQKTGYGPEVAVGKTFPMSWVRNWVEWLNFDNQNGNGPDPARPASRLNKYQIDSFLGVAQIHADVSWTANPLNALNFYAFGRLAWNTSLSADEVYAEWIGRTFGPALAQDARAAIRAVLLLSERAADNLGLYHGFRGVWYETRPGAGDRFRSPTSVNDMTIDKDGAGTPASIAGEALAEYSAGVAAVYRNLSDPRCEKCLLDFAQLRWDHRLANGRTLIEDAALRPSDGLAQAQRMAATWRGLRAAVAPAVGDAFWNVTQAQLDEFVAQAQAQLNSTRGRLAKIAKIPPLPAAPTPPPPPPPPPTPPTPPTPAPAHCSVSLTKQLSKRGCDPAPAQRRGADKSGTFGCTDGTGTMFVDGGCSGIFSCDGVDNIQCESHGEERASCSCAR